MATERNKPKSLFDLVLAVPIRIFAWSVGAIVLSILFEWIGMQMPQLWKAEGVQHSAQILQHDTQYLNDIAVRKMGALAQEPGELVLSLQQSLYYWLFQATHIEDGLNYLANNKVITEISDLAQAALNQIRIFVVRLGIVVFAMPLFIIFMLWGLVEGLVIRDLRRFGAAHESATVYHAAKYFVGSVFVLPFMVYLAAPFSINPAFIFGPAAAVLALNCLVWISRYKQVL